MFGLKILCRSTLYSPNSETDRNKITKHIGSLVLDSDTVCIRKRMELTTFLMVELFLETFPDVSNVNVKRYCVSDIQNDNNHYNGS